MEDWRDRCRITTIVLVVLVISQNTMQSWSKPPNLDARIQQCESDLSSVKRDVSNMRMDVIDLKRRSHETEKLLGEILELLKR